MKPYEDYARELMKTGAAFELCSSVVNGEKVRDFVNRPKVLAELGHNFSQYGKKICMVYGSRRISYADLESYILKVAGSLQNDYGVTHGDRVAILSANNPDWIITFWAVVSCGAVCAPLNSWWKEDEILYALRETGAKILIADLKRFQRIADRLDELPDLQAVFVVEYGDSDPLPNDDRVHCFSELTQQSSTAAMKVKVVEDDDAVIIFTSGTTGRPKGAVITHQAWITGLMNMGFATEVAVRMYPQVSSNSQPVVVLCTLPFFHVAGAHGLVLGAVASGARLVIPQGGFDPVAAMLLIEREGVTRWSAVPTMVWRLCTHHKRKHFALTSVRDIAYGGSPSSIRHQALARETFPGLIAISNAYGLTETGSVFAMNTGAEFEQRPGSVGRPFPTAEVSIVDNTGRVQPADVCGEIWVKGPFLMREYWQQAAATERTIKEGWLRTGDIGYFDEEGFLYVTDRQKDIIIRGGENISSAETENRILEHPDVDEVAVIGVEHPEWGEEVKAIIHLKDGANIPAEEIRQWVGEKLADFKVPAHIEFRSNPLPRNALGKLSKNELRSHSEPA